LLDSHPCDLSGGELQRAAVVKLMLFEPEVILLDEPTKGLDTYAKMELGAFLRELTAMGKTVVMVIHDLDFAAEYAHTCALFFDGKIHSKTWAKEFFSNNNFYTTDASRIARSVFPGVITTGELEKAVKEGEGK
jgi:energy-coupling factor transport system ATP-binding protein